MQGTVRVVGNKCSTYLNFIEGATFLNHPVDIQ